jgi:hypothetical protein
LEWVQELELALEQVQVVAKAPAMVQELVTARVQELVQDLEVVQELV